VHCLHAGGRDFCDLRPRVITPLVKDIDHYMQSRIVKVERKNHTSLVVGEQTTASEVARPAYQEGISVGPEQPQLGMERRAGIPCGVLQHKEFAARSSEDQPEILEPLKAGALLIDPDGYSDSAPASKGVEVWGELRDAAHLDEGYGSVKLSPMRISQGVSQPGTEVALVGLTDEFPS